MSNRLEELRHQCKRYFLKKALKASALFIAVLGISLIAYLGFEAYTQTPAQSEKALQNQTESPIEGGLEDKSGLQKKSAPAYTLSVSERELEKSIQTMHQKQSRVTKSEGAKSNQSHKAQKSLPSSGKSSQREKEVRHPNYFAQPGKEKPLDSWIEKYNQKKSYAVAIYIAKQYYAENNFKHSGIWAKRANQLDRNKEEAWLFYAKSVYALGNLDKAKRILNIYLQYKESTKAELLLSEWSQ